MCRGAKWSRPDHKFVTATEGTALLKALAGKKGVLEVQSASVSVWVDRSIAIYKSALSSGVLPSRKLLVKVLGCLRINHQTPKEETSETEMHAFDPYPYPEALLTELPPRVPAESCFDKRVVQVRHVRTSSISVLFCLVDKGGDRCRSDSSVLWQSKQSNRAQ